MDQLRVNQNPSVVDSLIHVIIVPFCIWHGERLQALADIPLGPHILQTIFLKLLPAFRVMFRQVPGPSPIAFGRFTGNGKITDQILASPVFLFPCFKYFCRLLQRQRQRQRGGMYHRTAPTVWRKPPSQIPSNTGSFKLRVPGCLDNLRVIQRFQHLGWEHFTACHIHNPYLIIIKSIGKEQDLKVRRLRVSKHTALGQLHTAEGFYINPQDMRLICGWPVF